jgi:PKD repeat protein
LTVSFDGSGSNDADGSISSYSWSFGDGYGASSASVDHTYTSAGQFTAVLTVTDDDGATNSASVVITVNEPANQAPTADVSATPISGDSPLTVSFDGSGSGDADGTISSYRWSFGDGSSATGMTVDHTYNSAGQFTAVLTVTDNDGDTDTDSVTITVSDPSILTAPVDLTATAFGNQVTLSWTAGGGNAGGYHIERAIKYRGKYSYSRIDSISSDATSYVDTVSETGTYKYRIQAYSNSPSTDEISDYSNETSVTVSDVVDPDPEPEPDPVDDFAAPSNLDAAINGISVVLTWTDNTSDEAGFTIERAIKVRGQLTYETIGQVGADQTAFTDACGAGTFYYRVMAFKAGVVSGYSEVISARVK